MINCPFYNGGFMFCKKCFEELTVKNEVKREQGKIRKLEAYI